MVYSACETAARNPTSVMLLAADGLSKNKTKVSIFLMQYFKLISTL